MSLTLALSNAVTGLRAMTAQSEAISNNVANALTEGYARKEVALSPEAPGGTGAGVGIDGVTRAVAPALADALRLAASDSGDAKTRADALARIAAAVGEPGAEGALSSRADALERALSAAADTPESPQLLSAATAAAGDYADKINQVANEAMALRSEADASIARQVAAINDAIANIEAMNDEIRSRMVTGADITALEDQRDRMIRTVSDMVPVRVIPREQGTVALFTKNGAQLLDGKVFTLTFEATLLVTPDQSIASGALSGLEVNGVPIPIGEGGGRGLMDGGSLSAAFEMRDRVIPAITADLDDLAADLALRTQGLSADPTLSPGDAGLFTDDGAAFDPVNLLGLSRRIRLNPAVDPGAGGAVHRLRDGIGAAAPGDVGAEGVLRGLQDALGALVAAPAISGLTGTRDASGFAASFSAGALTASSSAEAEAVFRRGRVDELNDSALAKTGVDSDQELTRLMAVEQAFAANARVVSAIDELMRRVIDL
ncbi:MAG: flagellar hook-associated protein FlgK [Pikeienuella sp.]